MTRPSPLAALPLRLFLPFLAGILVFAAPAFAVTTVEKRVAVSADDAEEFNSDGSIYITSTDLELIHDSSDQVVGMRWTGLTIPKNATITAAYVQFTAKEAQSEVTNLVLNGQAADNGATFTSTHLSISSRARTVASATWSPQAWATSDGAGAKQRTPSLSAIIQEIVNRPGWASGNSIVLVVTGTGHRCAYAFDGGAAQAPLLHVEYDIAPVNAAPVARLSVSQPPTPALTVNANGSTSTDTDAWPIASYRFDFGDGTPPVTTNAPTATASHAYASPGTYTVSLIATDTANLASAPATASITIQVDSPPVARVTLTQPPTPPLTVSANGSTSTDTDPWPIASYQFDWGDGTPPTTRQAPTATASHAYATAGTYTVTLIATDTASQASAPATAGITVIAENPPTAALAVSQLASPPLTVQADGAGSSDGDLTPIATYRFDWGDGTATATANAPTTSKQHTYAAAGTYTVTLIATDTGGNASTPATQSIVVLPPDDPPVARLTVSQPASPPFTVNADGSASTDTDFTPIATYQFDFGDGSGTVTTNAPTATASHAYAVAGPYTITLIVTDTGGKASAPVTKSITVQGESPPVARLALTQPATPALTVQADGSTSTDGDLTPIASYEFDFGDGSPTVTTSAPTATASHTYTASGPYTVTLIATDTGGNPSAPVSSEITVQAEDPPIAALSLSQATTPFLTVLANGSASSDGDLTPIASYRFDFGDGSPAVTTNAPTATASHTYAAAGSYDVTLNATDTGGNSSEPATETILIEAPPENPPVAQLAVTRVPVPELKINADGSGSTDTDLTPIASYRFDWGDSSPAVTTTAPTATASHTYASLGTYTVTLIVKDTGGNDSAPATQSIQVLPPDDPPVAHLSVSQPATPALTVQADGSTSTDTDFTPIASYRFTFGDGSAAVVTNAPTATASHTYATAGIYTVTLIATDTGGNPSTPVTQSITVQPDAAPVAALSVTQVAIPPLTVSASGSGSTDSDLTPIASYRFTFGDGSAPVTTNAPTATASHTYLVPGTYTVTLIVTDTGGLLSTTASTSITVGLDAPPVAQLTVTQPATPPLKVNADGSGSTDGDLTPIATYRFDFGDGTAAVTTIAPSATASHVYATAGPYTVTLVATDTGGNPSTPVTKSITVQPENPPVAVLSVSQPPTPPLTVNASGSSSTDGDLTPIATYRFTFGDGTAAVTTTAPSSTASHVYAAAGTYTVTLIATDTGGNASATATQSITVQPENPPVARLTVTPNATPGLVVTADGSTSTDTDLTPVASYRFTFGDGTAAVTTSTPTATAAHTYATAGTYTVTLVVTDTGGNASTQASASVTVTTTVSGTVDKRVAASSDDAEQSLSGSVSLTSSDLELIQDGSDQIVGMRFAGITIPRGATITNAYIQFNAKESQTDPTTLTIKGEASDNALAFTTSNGNVTGRTRTSAYATWTPVSWSSSDGAGANQRTPNLASPIQQIVNRSGWNSGNALVIIIDGTGHRTAYSYDGSSTKAPLLHVEYGNGSPPPDQAPVARLTVSPVGLTVNADGSTSTDGDLTPIASYRFTFGDGTSAVTVNAPNSTASHTYTTAGTYTVTLTATDTGGLTSSPVTQSVTVSGGTGGGSSGVAVFAGYMDTHHADQLKTKPNPWMGASNLIFIGNLDPGTTNGWDTSAIRIDNLNSTALTGVNVTVDMASHHFALWSAQTIPAGGRLVFAQTGFENFDGSDTSPAGCYSCNPNDCLTKVSSAVPVVHVTIGGSTTNYYDPTQILNTKGADGAGCPYTGTRNDESSNWVRIYPPTGGPSASQRAGETDLVADAGPKLSWLTPIFPNPSHGSIEVKFRTNYHGQFKIAVYDIAGRLQRELSDTDLDPGDYLEQVSLKGLAAGMYYLRVASPQGTMREPFVLAR